MQTTASNTWLERQTAQLNPARLSFEEEVRLARAWQKRKNRGALQKLVESHLYLVISTARRLKGYGVPLEDLMAEGNLGLLKAADRFEKRDVRFHVYAAYWVRAYMLAFVMRQRSLVTAATGAVGAKLFFKLRSARSRLEAQFGNDTQTIHEALARQFGVTVEQIQAHAARLSSTDASLDERLDPTSETTRGDLLADTRESIEEATDRRARDRAVRSVIHQLWSTLDAREQAVLRLRLTADEGDVTLAELGKSFSLSRERVRQIESKLKSRLKKALSNDARVLH
jgi:RNA polymerase sigma-32 factor